MAPIIANLVQIPPAVAASPTNQQAFDACNNAQPAIDPTARNGDCPRGYIAGYNGTSEPKGSSGFYDSGYKLGVQAKGGKPTTGNTKPPANVAKSIQQQAFDYCNKSFSGDVGNCTAGYEWGYTSSQKPTPCNSFCGGGYAQGVTDLGQDKANAPSGCPSNPTPSELQACQAGADGVGNNKTEDQTCHSYTGNQLAACKATWEKATAAAAGSANKQLGCEFQISNALTWIVCPIVFALTQTVNFVDNLITDQLNIKTNTIFCDTTGSACSAYYTAWQSFRDIALGLMAIAGLIIVIAQALGLEILDAYTLRKALPRLLVAAVGITLSWPLMRFLIQFSDDLGFGVRHLIYAPFAGLGQSLDLSFGQDGIVGSLFGSLGAAGAATAAIPAWLVLGGPAALLSFIGTAVLAVLVAVTVLILRQVAIILLMLLAPLAIVAYIMPNTQRVYRMWWESFSKALLMFPLIAAFIATGRVFSAIAINSGGSSVNQIIGFAAYFAPYFMIPLTFRMAGSSVGALGNFVQGRASGGFNALSGLRANQRKSRLERVRGAGLYRKKTGLTGALNKVGHYTVDADEQLPYVAGTKGGRVGKALFGRMAAEQAGQKGHQFAEQTAKAAEQTGLHYSAAWGALGMRNKLEGGMTDKGLIEMDDKYGFKYNDKGNLVKTNMGEKADVWQPPANADFHGLEEYGHTLASAGMDGSQARYGGEQLVEKAGVLSSYGGHMETQRASLQSVAAVSAARDGKLNAEDISTMHNNMVKEAKGDPAGIAFAAEQMTQLENASTQQRQDLRRGKGIKLDANGQAYSVYSDKKVSQRDRNGNMVDMAAYESQEALESLMTAKAGSIGQGKGEYYDETHDAYVAHAGLSEGQDVGNLTPEAIELRKTLAVQAGIYGAADPGARVKLDNLMRDMNISDDERKNYMSDYRAAEAGQAAQQPPTEPPAP